MLQQAHDPGMPQPGERLNLTRRHLGIRHPFQRHLTPINGIACMIHPAPWAFGDLLQNFVVAQHVRMLPRSQAACKSA